MPDDQRSLFITLAAQAMSSVGFSVSLIAWLWITLVPAAALPTPPLKVNEPFVVVEKRARRRSAPAALQALQPRSPSPSVRTTFTDNSSLNSLPTPIRQRRVYFVDSPSRPSPRILNDSSDMLDRPLHASPISEASPSSSSSTLVHTYTAIPPQTLETCRESAVESDSSSSPARRSLALSRPFRRKRTSSGTSVPDVPPMNPAPVSDSKQRRSSGSLISPWSFRRTSTSKSASSSAGAEVQSPTTSSASYFSRKSTRRVSTPVPRTQPYAHPYYAQPPVEDEAYVAYLRSLPQFVGAEAPTRTPTTSDSEEKESLLGSAALSRKRDNDTAQAALGLGRRPPVRMQRPQKRSASESWAAGTEPRL